MKKSTLLPLALIGGILLFSKSQQSTASNPSQSTGDKLVFPNGTEGSAPNNMSAPPNVVVSPFGGTMVLPDSSTTFPINTPQMSNLTPLQPLPKNTPVPSPTATTALLTNVSVQASSVASSTPTANDPLVAAINLARANGVTNQQITAATQKVSGSAPSTSVYFDARGNPIYVRG